MESRLWNTFSQGGCGLLNRTRWAVLGLAYAWVQASLQPPFVVLWSWPVTHCSPIPWGLHAAFCSSLPLSIMTLSLPVLDLITLTIKGCLSLCLFFFLCDASECCTDACFSVSTVITHMPASSITLQALWDHHAVLTSGFWMLRPNLTIYKLWKILYFQKFVRRE